ncbi:hypothetical protein E2C01_023199 [Portunus trituberculatus]|uniref:Secreted protein n=1 Tax=Portunus trituberculatus TaxID=210409 RepID=A0A5B7E9R7_PORTR|nr:hypothetical protein [Portunus trituberculatus]
MALCKWIRLRVVRSCVVRCLAWLRCGVRGSPAVLKTLLMVVRGIARRRNMSTTTPVATDTGTSRLQGREDMMPF